MLYQKQLTFPMESKVHPGFFEIPGFSRYVISRVGQVRRKSDGYEFNISDNGGYLTVRIIPDEFDDVSHNRIKIGIHRLICLVFNGIPDDKNLEDLDTNHINGIKKDNHPENLEFISRGENVRHAYRTGLNTWCTMRPVIVRYELTGIEQWYESISLATKALNVASHKTLTSRLELGPDRIWPGYLRLRYDDGVGFFKPMSSKEVEEEYTKYLNKESRRIVRLNIVTGEKLTYSSYSECARCSGIDKSRLCDTLLSNIDRVWLNKYRFRFLDSEEFSDIPKNYFADGKTVGIVAIDENGNQLGEFSSMVECASSLNISRKIVAARLSESKSATVNGIVLEKSVDYHLRKLKDNNEYHYITLLDGSVSSYKEDIAKRISENGIVQEDSDICEIVFDDEIPDVSFQEQLSLRKKLNL